MKNSSPNGATQIEIFRKMALLKANDERSRKGTLRIVAQVGETYEVGAVLGYIE